MRIRSLLLLVLAALLFSSQPSFAQQAAAQSGHQPKTDQQRGPKTTPQLGHDPIPEIVKQMTLEEKVKVVVGKGFSVPGLRMRSNDTTPDKLAGISGHTISISRFGIPSIGMADGPAGIHRFIMTAQDSADNLFSTAWPVGTLLASSWDTTLVKKVGVAFGD